MTSAQEAPVVASAAKVHESTTESDVPTTA
jgi:hypothetical protein